MLEEGRKRATTTTTTASCNFVGQLEKKKSDCPTVKRTNSNNNNTGASCSGIQCVCDLDSVVVLWQLEEEKNNIAGTLVCEVEAEEAAAVKSNSRI